MGRMSLTPKHIFNCLSSVVYKLISNQTSVLLARTRQLLTRGRAGETFLVGTGIPGGTRPRVPPAAV
jgi:hypothetical protein